MKERPILFSAPMVRALLAGTKTQTRRVVKITHRTPGLAACLETHGFEPRLRAAAELCPYGVPGDRLWVRETLRYDAEYGHYYVASAPGSLGNASGRTYLCTLFGDSYNEDASIPQRTVSAIHLPRRYSRITLEITAVRVERLQDISEADAIAEGIVPSVGGMWTGAEGQAGTSARAAYALLWNAINGAGSWDANPWVWCISFRRIDD